MDLVAVALLICIVEIAVLKLAFRTFERTEDHRARVELERVAEAERARPRFLGDVVVPADRAPLDALLARLEHHVRLEQEAAESFLRNPTAESLHHRTRPHVH